MWPRCFELFLPAPSKVRFKGLGLRMLQAGRAPQRPVAGFAVAAALQAGDGKCCWAVAQEQEQEVGPAAGRWPGHVLRLSGWQQPPSSRVAFSTPPLPKRSMGDVQWGCCSPPEQHNLCEKPAGREGAQNAPGHQEGGKVQNVPGEAPILSPKQANRGIPVGSVSSVLAFLFHANPRDSCPLPGASITSSLLEPLFLPQVSLLPLATSQPWTGGSTKLLLFPISSHTQGWE